MKRAFVVLVLFAGYNSGVIVPSAAPKVINETTALKPNDTNEITIGVGLEKSEKIDEKELLQTGNDKENVLNERAFIYINQRYKTLLRNQVYNSGAYGIHNPFVLSERLPKVLNVNVFNQKPLQLKTKPTKELFIPNLKASDNVKSKYSPPTFKYLDREVKNRFHDDRYILHNTAQVSVPVQALLNPFHEKVYSHNIHIKNFDNNDVEKETDTYNPEVTMKYPQSRKPDSMISYLRHRLNYNYGFPTAQQTHNSYSNPKLSFKEADISLERNLVTDNINNLSPLDVNDEDKLLDRYIKETLADFHINDNPTVVKPNLKKCQNCKSKTGKESKGPTTSGSRENKHQHTEAVKKLKYDEIDKSSENDILLADEDEIAINEALSDNELLGF